MELLYGKQKVDTKMGAEEVVKILEDSKVPLTSTEISELIEISCRTARRILKSLVKDSSINLKFKKLSFEEKKIRYGKIVNPTLIRVYWLEE